MIWNAHSRDVPEGAHAFLGASQYSWLNYDEDKLLTVYQNRMATIRGTELHDFAKRCIKLGQKLPRSGRTLNMYVNDAIGFRMHPEQPLYYSEYCFGTTDAIAFDEKKSFLRIHDLKTGKIPASMHQLEIYAALFFLEYGPDNNFKPGDVNMEFRIYQNDDILIGNPTASDIVPIIDKIVTFDRILHKAASEENYDI